jgi:hypothetical protein
MPGITAEFYAVAIIIVFSHTKEKVELNVLFSLSQFSYNGP